MNLWIWSNDNGVGFCEDAVEESRVTWTALVSTLIIVVVVFHVLVPVGIT